jgi:hypothetical protein
MTCFFSGNHPSFNLSVLSGTISNCARAFSEDNNVEHDLGLRTRQHPFVKKLIKLVQPMVASAIIG